MPWGYAATAIGSYMGSKGSKGGGSSTSTTQYEMNPALSTLLFGANNAEGGLLRQVSQLAQQGQSPGLGNFGAGIDSYLGGWGLDNFMRAQQSAQKLMETTNAAPQMQNTTGVPVQHIDTTQVNAPGQNNLDLSRGFNDFINGPAGANQYLTGAIGKGINQARNAYDAVQEDNTQNLLENVLPALRSNSIATGGFGGSRQGIAEGRAVSDFAKQQQRASSQFGQNATDSAVAAQAGAYDADRNRSLSALTNLSGQQYGVASQNAALDQQAQMANQRAIQEAATFNAGLRQQVNQNNLHAQLDTNRLNSQNQATGVGLSSSLLGQAYGYGQNNGNYAFDRLTKGTAALSPFTGLGTQTQTTPYYSNSTANALGGATAALGLWNQFGGSSMFGGSSGSSGAPSNVLF